VVTFLSVSNSSFHEARKTFRHFEPVEPFDVLAPSKHVPVKEAKAKLTELLRAVEAGERITLTRHGKPVADLVPHSAAEPKEKKMSVMERAAAWHKANPGPKIGWVADDFDDPLLEDFLLQPLPDDFDEKLAAANKKVADAWAEWEAQQRK
jgi:prevent-host-death family protein